MCFSGAFDNRSNVELAPDSACCINLENQRKNGKDPNVPAPGETDLSARQLGRRRQQRQWDTAQEASKAAPVGS